MCSSYNLKGCYSVIFATVLFKAILFKDWEQPLLPLIPLAHQMIPASPQLQPTVQQTPNPPSQYMQPDVYCWQKALAVILLW